MKRQEPLRLFLTEIYNMVISPFFIWLTVIGNSLIGLSSVLFYFLEKDHNPKLEAYIDAVWWSFATSTTTGYGDIVPVTFQGKVLGILMMLLGTALFAMYTALFAETILTSKKLNRKDQEFKV